MYRLNFYREYGEKRRKARVRAIWTGGIAGVVGMEFLFAISLLVSSTLLDEQAGRLETEIQQLSMAVPLDGSAASAQEIQVVRELAVLRTERIDWAPKLTAISERIDPSLRLERIVGQVAQKNGPPRFALTGVAAVPKNEMEVVGDFMRQLREDPRITCDLRDVRLETLKGGGTGRFQIVCESPEHES